MGNSCTRRHRQPDHAQDVTGPPLLQRADGWARLVIGVRLRKARKRSWALLGHYLNALRVLEIEKGQLHVKALRKNWARLGKQLARQRLRH